MSTLASLDKRAEKWENLERIQDWRFCASVKFSLISQKLLIIFRVQSRARNKDDFILTRKNAYDCFGTFHSIVHARAFLSSSVSRHAPVNFILINKTQNKTKLAKERKKERKCKTGATTVKLIALAHRMLINRRADIICTHWSNKKTVVIVIYSFRCILFPLKP